MKHVSILLGCYFLFLIAVVTTQVSAGEPFTVETAKALRTKHRNQMELAEFKKHLGHEVVAKGNPLFSGKVADGTLPQVADRLPKEPLVVIPETDVGTYGGKLRGLALSYESGTSEILSWRQANLVRFSSDNRTIVPNVAKSWKWSSDYTQITFFLRQGHRWSDGAPFTADDLVFYMEDIILNRQIHEKTPAPWKNLCVKAKKINEIVAASLEETLKNIEDMRDKYSKDIEDVRQDL